ncbi:hypothetical protein HDV03_002329 [Kappamyces sp. JEL0829]|nr:hypothetical protein HDV03_002329 [Kappamyces sp. JEL0829]
MLPEVTRKRSLFNFLSSAQVKEGQVPVNPKGYFANERTFLHWQSLCLVLGGLGIGLVNFSSTLGQASGVIFTVVAMGFSLYALVQYLQRSDLLSEKSKGLSYEDISGALLMVFVVFIAIGINFGLHFLSE